MVVIVAFERPGIQYFRTHFPGIYRDAFLIVASGSRVTCYHADPTECFRSRGVRDLNLDDASFDLFVLDTSPDEDETILRTCDACCECRIRYSLWDQYLRGVPFWYPTDISLFEARQMYGAQSVVLILRECLSQENPLLPVMLAINSRTISPRVLQKELSQFSFAIPAKSADRLLSVCRADAVRDPSRV